MKGNYNNIHFFFILTAEREGKERTVKRVPKGTSDYQASWIVDSDKEGGTGEEIDSSDDDDSILGDVRDDSDESMVCSLLIWKSCQANKVI